MLQSQKIGTVKARGSVFLSMLSLLALSLAPGIAIIFYIYSKDKYDREPFENLFISFLLGVVCTVPAALIQRNLQPQLDHLVSPFSITYYFIWAFILVAFSEEGSKFLVLRLYSYRQKAFNEPFDGIVYSVMVSMGFATLENVLYVFHHGFATGILRMFLSVPAHACFGVLMGYHTGLAKFDPEKSALHLWKGLLLAVFFHGSFDFFLFLQNNPNVTRYVSESLLVVGALISYWIAIRLSLRSIRQHQALSNRYLKTPEIYFSFEI
ncbi:PrsW family intramembrane metalloprotease [Paraflavitalea speifideaquila]|uniref:PrsW family intramembrane metalloprotease n=1 Tax=Paraflavitalea speifideaquila TaxID=3076558 RepID=UPI0028E7BFDB|nr:PrsW family glutamic-type intramembrane protease [Paraflavitalea speifideiaquila]